MNKQLNQPLWSIRQKNKSVTPNHFIIPEIDEKELTRLLEKNRKLTEEMVRPYRSCNVNVIK